MIPADTSPEAFAAQVAVLRRMSDAERLRTVVRMSRAVRHLTLAGLRRDRPGLSEDALKRELLRRLYPEIPLPPAGP